MFKAKRLFAAVLVVIMAVSMVTFSAFASDKLVFSEDYTPLKDAGGYAAVKNSAVIITSKANGKEEDTEITVRWEGEDYIFVVGVNAFTFDNFDKALSSADILATDGLPQILLEPGVYPKLEITGAVQIFGALWKENPNVPNLPDSPDYDPKKLTTIWGLNPKWGTSSNVTRVNDVVISAGASGVIDIYGIEITHRFYDCFRPISGIKTTLTLRNIRFNQTDTTTTILTAPTGRSYAKCAMSFWNANSSNNGASAVNNKDETHLVNFRLSKLNMDSGGDNRFIDEIVSPTFVIDGFCADYKTADGKEVFDCGQMFWMKWMDANPNTKCIVKNSYFTSGFSNNTSTGKFDFDFEGFANNKVADPAKGESAELIFDNNIFCDHYMADGNSNIMVYQQDYSLVSFKNNMFINTKGGASPLVNWRNIGAGNLSDNMEFINNTYLGYSPLNFDFGSEDTQISVDGSYIQAAFSTDYATLTSDILPTGKVKFDYCYIDGAKKIKTNVIQKFKIVGEGTQADPGTSVLVDRENLTINVSVDDGYFYKTPKVVKADSIGSFELHEAATDFADYDEFNPKNSKAVPRCVLEKLQNHYYFVWYSPDKKNYHTYKFTVDRPEPKQLVLQDVAATPGAVIDGVQINSILTKDDDKFTFTPGTVMTEGVEITDVKFKLFDLATNDEIKPVENTGKTFEISGLVRGEKKQYMLQIESGFDKQFYVVNVLRPFNDAAELVDLDDKFVDNNGVYTANVAYSANEFSFTAKISEDATAIAWAGTAAYPLVDGKITITDLSVTEYKFAVIAESGRKGDEITLKLNKVKSSENQLVSVNGAEKTADGYKVAVADKFTVSAKVSDNATYAVYADAACTQKLDGGVVPAGSVAYIVVTAENGTAAPAVKITVDKKVEEQKPVETPEEKPVETKDTAKVFTDVKAKKWYKDAIDYTYSRGYISGISETEFGVNSPVTRGMFITILARIAGVDTSANKGVKTNFDDVKSGKYYTAAIKWASDNDIVDGIDNKTFAPDAPIERQQLCVMITSFASFMKVDIKGLEAEIAFKDAGSIAKYAKKSVKACQMADVINGYEVEGGFEFAPKKTASRAEAAQILYKFHDTFMK